MYMYHPLPPTHTHSVDSPEDLYESGIFISDLSMHDSSRDFVLAGSQLNPELNLALNQVWEVTRDPRLGWMTPPQCS